MRRIVIDGRYISKQFSGIGTYSRCLVEHLARLDTETKYTVLVHKSFRGHLNVGENFEIRALSPRPMSVRTLTGVGRAATDQPLNVFHSLFPLAPLWSPGPLLITLHDLQPFQDPDFHGRRPRLIRWAYGAFYGWAYPSMLRLAKWIMVDSNSTRAGLRAMFPELAAKAIVVPAGLSEDAATPPSEADIERVRQNHGLETPFLFYYGSTRPNKNLPRLIEAFARFRARNPGRAQTPLALAVQPDRFFEDATAVIKREKLQNAVRILPPVNELDRKALLCAASVFCFPTMYEGFGLPVLEAQAMGTPVLASTSGALPEVGGKGALYAAPDDVDDIADKIARLVEDENLRRALADKGRANYRRFSWDETARQTLDIYSLLF